MSFFNFFSKKTDEKGGSGKDPNNNNNNPSKPSLLKLSYESNSTGELDSLNAIIKDFKHDKMVFKDYDDYLHILNFIMSK